MLVNVVIVYGFFLLIVYWWWYGLKIGFGLVEFVFLSRINYFFFFGILCGLFIDYFWVLSIDIKKKCKYFWYWKVMRRVLYLGDFG